MNYRLKIKEDIQIQNVILEAGDVITIHEAETVDIKKIVKDLQGDFGGNNDSQMKGVQLLKGLATSDDPLANKYMNLLNTATTKISKEVLGE